jgi:hypothetical protein
LLLLLLLEAGRVAAAAQGPASLPHQQGRYE